MIVKTIGVSYTRKFNLGGYEHVELSCSMWARLSNYEDEIACTEILQDHVREAVRSEYYKVRNGSEPVEVFRVNTDIDNKPENDEDFETYLPEPDVYINTDED
jgi:hypothetical protein